MKKILMLIIILPAIALAQNYRIDWYVFGSGGGHTQSGNYQLDGTIGQPIIGQSFSPNYIMQAGFWVGSPALGPNCDYIVGDINNSGGFNGVDVVFAVSYFKGGTMPPYACECTPGHTWFVAGDVNASCNFNGVDVTYAVSYFKGGPGPHPCVDCPPGGLLAPPLPGTDPTLSIRPTATPISISKPRAGGAD